MSEKREESHESKAQEPDLTDAPAPEEGEPEEKYSFLQETFKDEQVTRKTIWNVVWKTAGKGLIFGLAACLAFCALKPWADSIFSGGSNKVTIPEDKEDEEIPEDTEEEDKEETVYPDLTIDDYRELSKALYQTASEANRCVAEVSAVKDAESWENNSFDSINSVSGAVIWESGTEVLVLAPARIVKDAESLSVIFADGIEYKASLKKQDRNLGLAVFAVEKRLLADSTKNQMKTAVLGNSNVASRGDPVIVSGKQFGYAGGIGYGIISSVRNRISVADGEYKILTTDIAAADGGSGVLFNVSGEVIGIVDQKISDQSSMNLVTAYAISDIKGYIEQLSNGKGIPYVGIHGVEVTESLSEERGIPKGIYVKEVEADSPAMQAGIQSGDVITAIGNTTVSTIALYKKNLMDCEVGEQIKIRGQRQGASGYVDVNFTVTIGSKE